MNRQSVQNFEILLLSDFKSTTGIQSTNYISHGDCFLTYVGNFLIVESKEKIGNTFEYRFTPYNLDNIKIFRFSDEVKSYYIK